MHTVMHGSTAAGVPRPPRSAALHNRVTHRKIVTVPVVVLTWVHEIMCSSILGNLWVEDHIVTRISIYDTRFLLLGPPRTVLINDFVPRSCNL